MGNGQSSRASISPQVLGYVQLASRDQKETGCLVHSRFSKKFCSNDKPRFDRSMSPFCPISLKNTENWMTVCLISPLMAIVSPVYIIDSLSQSVKKCEILADAGGKIEPLKAHEVVIICKRNICLVVLEEPYCKVGWAGLTYINSIQQLNSMDIRLVSHPQRILDKQLGVMTHTQEVTKVNFSRNSKTSQDFTVKNSAPMGSVYCKVKENKVYIVGLQISAMEALFFSKKVYKQMQSKAKAYIQSMEDSTKIFSDAKIQQAMQQIQP